MIRLGSVCTVAGNPPRRTDVIATGRGSAPPRASEVEGAFPSGRMRPTPPDKPRLWRKSKCSTRGVRHCRLHRTGGLASLSRGAVARLTYAEERPAADTPGVWGGRYIRSRIAAAARDADAPLSQSGNPRRPPPRTKPLRPRRSTSAACTESGTEAGVRGHLPDLTMTSDCAR